MSLQKQLEEYKEKYIYEKAKNDVYLDIILNNTNIKLSDICIKPPVKKTKSKKQSKQIHV